MWLEPERALEAVVTFLEIVVAALVLLALARVAWLALRRQPLAQMRIAFAETLLLALDVAIGADVLRVAIAPSLQKALVALVVVAARIALTLVLLHELRQDRSDVRPTS